MKHGLVLFSEHLLNIKDIFDYFRTLIDCSHICEDDEYCLMFHWDESSSSCELGGSSNEFKHVEGGKISYVYPQCKYRKKL